MSENEAPLLSRGSLASICTARDDPEGSPANPTSPLRSPLMNRLPAAARPAGSSLTTEEANHCEAAVRQIIKQARGAKDAAIVCGVLKALAKEVPAEAVEEGCRRFAGEAQRLSRTPSLASQRRVRAVCLTSVHGVLNAHLVAVFLKEGIRVVGIVGDKKGLAKAEYLTRLPGAEENLTLEACDMRFGGLTRLFATVDVVMHSVWPAMKAGRSAEETIERATRLTRGVMSAATASASVRHVVITSSTAAVRLFAPLADPARGYGGDDWSDEAKLEEAGMTPALALLRSEQAAWEMHSQQLSSPRESASSGNKIKTCSICVGQVVGPPLGQEVCVCASAPSVPHPCTCHFLPQLDAGSQKIRSLLMGEAKCIPQEYMQYVDVCVFNPCCAGRYNVISCGVSEERESLGDNVCVHVQVRDAARIHYLAAMNRYSGRAVCVAGVASYEV